VKSPGLVARTSNAVAEVGRRRLVSNKLGIRAPKRAAGSSERGPSSERGSAGETVGRHIERSVSSRIGLTAKDGRAPEEDPGWREIVIQRFSHRQKRCEGRGTGAVMATGSYEGPLPIEGIPDHHEAQTFTSRCQRWSRRSPHSPTRTNPSKRRTYGEAGSAREGERGERVNGARDRGVRGSVAISAVGRKRPRSCLQAVRQ
jgi:hypothetical protein